MARANQQPDDSERFEQDLLDRSIERDDHREPRCSRSLLPSLERQRNQARFADILSGTAERYNRGEGR